MASAVGRVNANSLQAQQNVNQKYCSELATNILDGRRLVCNPAVGINQFRAI